MEWDYGFTEADGTVAPGSLFIVNEGNFQYGNSTLSAYNPTSEEVVNEAFIRSNGYKLGDVGQSAAMHGGLLWIVVNNSHIIWAVDPVTLRERGRIEGLVSPRYIHFVSDTKAYVTQLWDNRITIVNPKTFSITGYIDVPGMSSSSGSTEQMVQLGNTVYCNCWSYQNKIISIDTTSDRVTGQLSVGIQPRSIALDALARLWVITDGGYPTSPTGTESPTLCRVSTSTFTVEKRWRLDRNETPTALTLNAAGDTLYWIARHVWRMPVTSDALPTDPFIPSRDTRYYAMTLSPVDGTIYLADAIDYSQPGSILRYTPSGQYIDQFTAGITPGAFCWFNPAADR